jgi:hypothetical protein
MKTINCWKLLGLLLLSFAALPAFSGAASGPVTFTCVKDGTTSDQGTFQLVLDEDAKTAVFAHNPVSPAGFTDTTVNWKVDLIRVNYHIQLLYQFNRQTSVLTQSFTAMKILGGIETDSNGTATYHCAVQ